jgi:hypothetical protein
MFAQNLRTLSCYVPFVKAFHVFYVLVKVLHKEVILSQTCPKVSREQDLRARVINLKVARGVHKVGGEYQKLTISTQDCLCPAVVYGNEPIL